MSLTTQDTPLYRKEKNSPEGIYMSTSITQRHLVFDTKQMREHMKEITHPQFRSPTHFRILNTVTVHYSNTFLLHKHTRAHKNLRT